MQALLAAYQEAQRHYHTQQHLAECLQLAERFKASPELSMALWFHDAVYALRAPDNEAQSAAWAGQALQEAGVAPGRIARIQALIMATCHQAQPQEAEAQLMVDIDLAILGAPAPRFAEYQAQIRREYAWVPEAEFREKRRAVLQAFAQRRPLYHSPGLAQEREAQARHNLAQALAV